MPTVIRYILLQIPGWILLACLLGWIVSNGWLGLFMAVVIMALWIVKDALLYPLAKAAYEIEGPPIGAKALVGREGKAVTEIGPQGIVKVGGELWIAQAVANETISKGRAVRIIGSESLILSVEQVG